MNNSNTKEVDPAQFSTETLIVEELDQVRDDIDNFEDRQLFIDLSEENKSIHLNDNLHGLHKSATLEINEICSEMIKQGKEIHKFGIGQSPFPIPEIIVQALRDNAHQKDYLPVKGLYELRNAVAGYHQRKNKIKIDAEQVLIGPGSKELLFLLQLTFDGDLIVPSPCWVSYIPQAIIIGRKIRLLQTDFDDKWRITANKLKALCEEDKLNKYNRPRLLVLNYPGNPDGTTYSIDELVKIANVAKKYNILILSDEIYGELNFEDNHVSIASFYPKGTIISSGLSKWAGAGGWRLGTFIFPRKLKWLQDAMAVVASETYTSVSAPIQFAAITAFNGDISIDIYLEKTRKILKAIGNWAAIRLQQKNIRVHEPQGAFYLFIDFENYRDQLINRNIKTSKELVNDLFEKKGVALLPGIDFFRPSDEYTARLAYVNFDGEYALSKLNEYYASKEIDEDFILNYCSATYNGIIAIEEWIISNIL